jgi:hypothetical protein
MRRSRFIFFGALASVVAACQAGTPVPSAPTPTTAPSGMASSAAPVASAAPIASSAPSPAVERVQVSGKLYDDEGRVLPDGTVEVRSTDGSIQQSIKAIGGAYAVTGVPVGTVLTLTATHPGFTPRVRVLAAAALPPDEETNPNEMDFGGPRRGVYYALSSYPEIVSVAPANKATGVASTPLEIAFKLSRPLSGADRGRFGKLLQVRFPVPSYIDPDTMETKTEVLIKAGTGYNEEVATLTWNANGDEGTFRFNAPLVTRQAATASVTVGFDQSVPLDEWPEDDNGKPLGRGVAPETFEGSGSKVLNQIAPFWRGPGDLPVPSAKPSPLDIWGKTHATTSTFSLSPDTKGPKVKEVIGFKGDAGGGARILVVFDEPMRAYPEAALDGSAVRASNYRFVLGRTDDDEDAEEYETSDPVKNGSTPPLDVVYSPNRPDTVILNFPAGYLRDFTVFKLYVDPAVKDPAGNSVQSSPQDPATALSDNVLEGKII